MKESRSLVSATTVLSFLLSLYSGSEFFATGTKPTLFMVFRYQYRFPIKKYALAFEILEMLSL